MRNLSNPILGAVLAVSLSACTRRAPSLEVPRAAGAITIGDGSDEPAWLSSARTGDFLAVGSAESARPHSEAWFLHDGSNLYLSLYAADQDLRSGSDAFVLEFLAPRDGARISMRITVDGTLRERRVLGGVETPAWKSGTRFAIDKDEGTIDDPSDDDEEWVVEMAIPFTALSLDGAGAAPLRLSISRCDVPKDGIERCGEWGVSDGEPAGILRLAR